MARMTGIEVKKLLKQHGINTKFVKVTNDHSAMRVTLMSKDVCKETVENIVGPMERIRRCEATGDILSGGNFFVFVQYHWSVIFNNTAY